ITKRTSIFESEEITTDIKDYFNLPFIKLKSDEEKYSEMSIQQIADKVIVGVNTNDISNIERINSNRYSYKLDYFLFCANLRNKDIFETDRLQRILHNMPDQDRKVFINTFYKLFKVCSVKGRLSLMKFFVHYCDSHKINHSQLVDQLYTNDTKDIVYFGFLAQKLNPKFSRSGGNKSV
ncbi:MAG: hypothetical protein GX660_03880, partial [Clostridiaceae bacterium]|nr:hypothetical protein [Clostridiaceae bacterium]